MLEPERYYVLGHLHKPGQFYWAYLKACCIGLLLSLTTPRLQTPWRQRTSHQRLNRSPNNSSQWPCRQLFDYTTVSEHAHTHCAVEMLCLRAACIWTMLSLNKQFLRWINCFRSDVNSSTLQGFLLIYRPYYYNSSIYHRRSVTVILTSDLDLSSSYRCI